MNKVIHGSIAVVFGIACGFLWAMLKFFGAFTQEVLTNERVPAFTLLCMHLRPLLLILPGLAVVYCLWTWFREDSGRASWQGFFATVSGVTFLLLLPTMLAVGLLMINLIETIRWR
jgi:hypothetical protein